MEMDGWDGHGKSILSYIEMEMGMELLFDIFSVKKSNKDFDIVIILC